MTTGREKKKIAKRNFKEKLRKKEVRKVFARRLINFFVIVFLIFQFLDLKPPAAYGEPFHEGVNP